MVRPSAKIKLLYLSPRSGGMGSRSSGDEEDLLLIARDSPGEEIPGSHRVLRLAPEACDDPTNLSSRIAAAVEGPARENQRIALHPSLWRPANWNPRGLPGLLATQGFQHIALVLDGSWEEENPGDLLALVGSPAGLSRPDTKAFLDSIPVPACLVSLDGEVMAAGDSWIALEKVVGRENALSLFAKARERLPAGESGEAPLLLPLGSRWFELWRGPCFGSWDPALWLAVDVTERMAEIHRERNARNWLEGVISTMNNWVADPACQARVLSQEVKCRTGYEMVLVFTRVAPLSALSVLGGEAQFMEKWADLEVSEADDSPISWVVKSGRSFICRPSSPVAGVSTELLDRMGVKSCLCLPLTAQGQVLGVLMAGSPRHEEDPSWEIMRDLEAACMHAGVLLYAGKMYQESRGTALEWERIFNSVDQPVLFLDPDFKVLRANHAASQAARLATVADLVGRNGVEVVYGQESPPESCLIKRVLRSGRTAMGYRNLPTFGGRYQITVHPMPGPGGVPVGVVLFARNVTRESELEGRFRGVVDNSNALFLVTDPWGIIQFAAGVWESLLGYSVGEVQGRNFSDFVHNNDRTRVVETFSRLGVKPGKVKDFYYRAAHKSGEIRWHQVTGYSESDQKETSERLYLFISDVTELVRSQEASETKKFELRKQRDMLGRFLAVGTQLHQTTDLYQKLEMVCQAVRDAGLYRRVVMGLLEDGERRFRVVASEGATPQELSLIENADSLLGEDRDLQGTNDFQLGNSFFIPREARLTGESFREAATGWEKVDRWQEEDLLIIPLRNREERLIGLLVVDDPPDGKRPTESTVRTLELLVQMAVSAVEHTLLQEDVVHREQEWEAIFGQVDEMVAVVDQNGLVRRINKKLASFLGESPAKLVGREAPALLRMGERAGGNPLMDTLLTGCSITQRIVWSDRELRVTVRPWAELDKSGRAGGVIWVGRFSQEGRESSHSRLETLGSMAGGIVHDFNNILCAIQGHISLMIMESEGKTEESQTLKQVEQACLSASKMVGRLLDFSREREGKKQNVDLGTAVIATMDLLRHTIPSSISFDIDIPDDRIIISTETGVIDELLANLVVNARDAMPDGGKITVSVNPPGQAMVTRLVVQDTGHGIPAENIDKIFEPWFTTRQERGGSGLGLSVVKRVATDLGGGISVQSEPGKGTRFDVLLPVLSVEAPKPEDGERAPVDVCRGNGETVLVVDDEEPVLDLLCNVLQYLGYRFLAAADGDEALHVYRQRYREIDIIITDFTMPGMSGRDLVDEIKALNPTIPVVISSGLLPDAIGSGLEDGFLAKPFQVDDVANILYTLLASRR